MRTIFITSSILRMFSIIQRQRWENAVCFSYSGARTPELVSGVVRFNIIGCPALRKVSLAQMRSYGREIRCTQDRLICGPFSDDYSFRGNRRPGLGRRASYPPHRKGPIFPVGDPQSREPLYSLHLFSLIFSLTIEEIDFLPPRGTTRGPREIASRIYSNDSQQSLPANAIELCDVVSRF